MDFTQQVALVTGRSGGIGRELSMRLAAAGAAVAVHYGTDREAAEDVAGAIAARGGRVATFAADLQDVDAPVRLVDALEAELAAIDLLAANAGLSHPGSMRTSTPRRSTRRWR